MEKRELICTCCPLGCPMTVSIEGELIKVTGNTCNRGETYAQKEILSPTRIVTSTVKVENGCLHMVSVKTRHDIPKDKIFDCMKEIKKMKVYAPIAIGDVIIADCAGTGVDVVATRKVDLVG